MYCACGPLFARIYCACGFDYKNMLCLRAWSREIFCACGFVYKNFVPAGLFPRVCCVYGFGSINCVFGMLYCSCLWLGLCRPARLLVASHNFISQALFFPTQHVRYFLLSNWRIPLCASYWITRVPIVLCLFLQRFLSGQNLFLFSFLVLILKYSFL